MKSRIWLALLTLYIAWGTTYLAIRFAIETIPPFFMTGTRFLVAGLVLFIWRRVAGDPAPTRAQWRSAAIIGTFLLVGGIGAVTLAERHIPSGIAALVVASTPLWVVLINAIRPSGERPSLQAVIGVFVGLTGIFILVNPGSAAGHQSGSDLLGIGAILLATLSWSIGSIYSRTAVLPASPLLGSGMELLVGSIGSFIVGILTGEGRLLNISAVSLRSLTGLGYLIVVGSLIGFVCFTWLLRVAPTSLVVTYAYVNPLVAVILGSLVAGEVLSSRVLVAAPMILVSVGLVNMRRVKTKSLVAAPTTAQVSAGDD